jgi:hypothetical protein
LFSDGPSNECHEVILNFAYAPADSPECWHLELRVGNSGKDLY